MPTVRTPEAPCRRSPSRDPRCCLPLWEMGSATPITIDFGAIFPFTCVPAYSFPVYASQRPLPDATQDSVRGCWLGFAAVAISGACASRAFKAQPPQNGACGFCRIRLLGRWLRYAHATEGLTVIRGRGYRARRRRNRVHGIDLCCDRRLSHFCQMCTTWKPTVVRLEAFPRIPK